MRACVHIYSMMSMHGEAVALALQVIISVCMNFSCFLARKMACEPTYTHKQERSWNRIVFTLGSHTGIIFHNRMQSYQLPELSILSGEGGEETKGI